LGSSYFFSKLAGASFIVGCGGFVVLNIYNLLAFKSSKKAWLN